MKKIITICAAILMTASVFAQTPEKMSYQAVVRDGSNNLVSSTAVGMQISILQGSASGTAVYVETQTPTSNANGLVSIEIGGGTVVSGNFATIDWANGPYFVKTETDPAGGTNYSVTGTSQLLSVPYALYAKNTDSWLVNGNTTYTFKTVGIGTSSPSSPLEVHSAPGGSAHGLKLVRNTSGQGLALPLSYELFNNANQQFRFGNISSGILDNIAGQEKGFISFQVADGTGSWGTNYQQEKLRLTTIGLGIGIQTPQRVLHVNDVMRLEPRTSAPTSPAKGDIYFDNTLNKLRVYDGTTWQNCW
jgi:hypothetical protein